MGHVHGFSLPPCANFAEYAEALLCMISVAPHQNVRQAVGIVARCADRHAGGEKPVKW